MNLQGKMITVGATDERTTSFLAVALYRPPEGPVANSTPTARGREEDPRVVVSNKILVAVALVATVKFLRFKTSAVRYAVSEETL